MVHSGVHVYRVFSEFLYRFKFAAISFIRILPPNHKREKYAKNKAIGGKIPKKGFKTIFGYFFWAQNEDLPNDTRAYVLAEVGAVIR